MNPVISFFMKFLKKSNKLLTYAHNSIIIVMVYENNIKGNDKIKI